MPTVHRHKFQKPVSVSRSHPKGSSSRGVQTLVSTWQDRAPIGQHRDSVAENERVVPAGHWKKGSDDLSELFSAVRVEPLLHRCKCLGYCDKCIAVRDRLGQRPGQRRVQSSAMTMPAAALKATTASGGARHAVSRTKPTSATAKSRGECTEDVQTGS